ncbi:hypothetical protein DER46DRAFT_660785 [Fusarium sp. MPI-SDFR-AT-0072]|nr:hypothetical protein DER46DRAFT_660785 [Fusarium sp. MPI-SDFR-AT-0072]
MYYVNTYNGDCFSCTIEDDGKPNDGKKWVSEHILELQTINMFIEYSMGVKRKLRDRKTDNGIKFEKGFPAWNKKYLDTPRKSLFTLLGSATNAVHMVNAESKFNGHKARVEQVFGYLTKPAIKQKLQAAYNDVKNFLDDFEELYREEHPKTPVLGLSKMWTRFMQEVTGLMQQWTKDWVKYHAGKIVENWLDKFNKREAAVTAATGMAAGVVSKAVSLRDEAKKILEDAKKHQSWHADFINIFNPIFIFQ